MRIFLDTSVLLSACRSSSGASRAILESAGNKIESSSPTQGFLFAAYWNDLAWAVRGAVGIMQAFEILLQAVQTFPEDAMTNFNLECYLCQMGEIEKSKDYVGKAINLDGNFRILAFDDSDLEPSL